jgi:hypothetical protein
MASVRLVTLGLVVLTALVVASPAAAQGTNMEVPLVRMRDGHGSDLLFRLDPRTLRQVGPPIRTFRNGTGLSISSDGTRLAFADGAHPRHPRHRRRTARIHFVDIARWRSMGVARVGRHGWLTVGWVGQDRVVAISGEGYGPQRLLWVDAKTRKVVARRSFAGWVVNMLPVPGGLALALGPREGLGPLRILVLDPNGGKRIITLDGIEAGADYGEPGGRVLTPAVTADPQSGQLYVVAARGLLVAEVDPVAGAVSYHSLGASAAKGNIDTWWRYAAWAGDGRIAVTGDHWPAVRGRRPPAPPVPFGLRVIDTTNWSIDTLDPRPDWMHVADGTVLATRTQWFYGGRRAKSTGLLAFDQSGGRAFTRFRGLQVTLLGSRGHLGYAWVRRTSTAHVIDLSTGRTLNTIRTGRRAPWLLSP